MHGKGCWETTAFQIMCVSLCVNTGEYNKFTIKFSSLGPFGCTRDLNWQPLSHDDPLTALLVGTGVISLRNSQYRVFINSFLFIPCDGWMLPITGSSCKLPSPLYKLCHCFTTTHLHPQNTHTHLVTEPLIFSVLTLLPQWVGPYCFEYDCIMFNSERKCACLGAMREEGATERPVWIC